MLLHTATLSWVQCATGKQGLRRQKQEDGCKSEVSMTHFLARHGGTHVNSQNMGSRGRWATVSLNPAPSTLSSKVVMATIQ